MIELTTPYSLSQIPHLTHDVLDKYAEKLIHDFYPEALYSPGELDVDHFIEYYLHLSVDYRRICLNQKVLGLTVFNDGVVDVLCEDTGMIEKMPVQTGTVIIDSSLCTKRNVPRLRFTLVHEGSHWLLHRKAFSDDNPFGPVGIYENQYIAAKEGCIDYRRTQSERTDVERMERQADFLSAAILMNRPALRKAYKDFFAFYDEKPRRVIRGNSALDDCFAQQLPEYVAKVFGVSKRAALIRLEKLTAIVNKSKPY